MAIVAEGERGRIYLSPLPEHEAIARQAKPAWKPEVEFFEQALGFRVGNYGMSKWSDLFTDRQLVALTTFSDLISEARERIRLDSIAAGLPVDGAPLRDGGSGAEAYAEALTVYLGLGISKLADSGNALVSWKASMDQPIHLFTRQTIPMVWDFAEPNVFGNAMGDLLITLKNIARVLDQLPAFGVGIARQNDAQTQFLSGDKLVSTDPPYFDNVGYADLSDFFYVWLRRSLRPVFPDLFATVNTPKTEELVATPDRHGGKEKAEVFFLEGMTHAMHRIADQAHPAFPVTVYYAFKQAESDDEEGTASTGWEIFLDAAISAGFALTGTWPMRTELGNRMRSMDSNALASSIVLVCRKRSTNAVNATRREFVNALKVELPVALAHLQRGNIAPVDVAQAAIGPGMAVYTRYAKVLDAEGKALTVREALTLINQTLDEALAEQEGDFDNDSRWALAWFGDHGFEEGPFGDAHTYFVRFNTAENALKSAGIIESGRGRVRLYAPAELPAKWDPATDPRLTAWEVVHQLIRALEAGGESATAALVAKLGAKAEIARELAYRLYTVCERKKRAVDALSYNGLVQSWPEITRLAREGGVAQPAQAQLFEQG
jgi:putative DNA methylase